MNWLKVGAILSSNLFFFASCTGITFLSTHSLKYVVGKSMARGEKPDPLMIVIASIPDTEIPEKRKLDQVLLGDIPRFQRSQPDHTFVIPSGDGYVRDVLGDWYTSYRATRLGAGRVLVETDAVHDVPPFGLNIVGSYEATEREIKPLYTYRSAIPLIADVFVGLVGASILVQIGSSILREQQRRPKLDQHIRRRRR